MRLPGNRVSQSVAPEKKKGTLQKIARSPGDLASWAHRGGHTASRVSARMLSLIPEDLRRTHPGGSLGQPTGSGASNIMKGQKKKRIREFILKGLIRQDQMFTQTWIGSCAGKNSL